MSTYEALAGPTNSRFGPVWSVESTGSTNADLFAEASAGAAEGLTLVAEHQEAGRGRQGRAWVDHGGSSLFMSFLLRPNGYELGLIPGAVGLAVLDALEPWRLALGLKWPNDVLVGGRGAEKKLGGILAEVGDSDDGGRFVVVGIGVNLVFGTGLDPEVRERSADLATSNEPPPSPVDMGRRILESLEPILVYLESGHVGRVLERYRSECVSIGRVAEFDTPTGRLVGQVVGIANDGSLRLRTPEGISTYTAGDLHHRDDLTVERAFHRPW